MCFWSLILFKSIYQQPHWDQNYVEPEFIWQQFNLKRDSLPWNIWCKRKSTKMWGRRSSLSLGFGFPGSMDNVTGGSRGRAQHWFPASPGLEDRIQGQTWPSRAELKPSLLTGHKNLHQLHHTKTGEINAQCCAAHKHKTLFSRVSEWNSSCSSFQCFPARAGVLTVSLGAHSNSVSLQQHHRMKP